MSEFLGDSYKNQIKSPSIHSDADSLRFYKFITDCMPAALVTVSADLKITGFNPWAEKITGYFAEDVLGRYCGDILQGGMCNLHCPLKTVITRETPIVGLETTIHNRDREIIPVRMHTAALLDDDGGLIGGVEAFVDISDAKTLEQERYWWICPSPLKTGKHSSRREKRKIPWNCQQGNQ